MNQTTNYALNQWEEGDRVSRADFNSDNSKLDAAIKSVADTAASAQSAASAAQSAVSSAAKLAAGSYVGDDAESRTISVGFTPKAVLVCDEAGRMCGENVMAGDQFYYGGMAVTGGALSIDGHTLLEVVSGGFTVHSFSDGSTYGEINTEGSSYRYLALG